MANDLLFIFFDEDVSFIITVSSGGVIFWEIIKKLSRNNLGECRAVGPIYGFIYCIVSNQI